MERTTFLKNYQIRRKYDGSPYEPDRDGPAISYEGVGQRTAEPVSVTLIPAESMLESTPTRKPRQSPHDTWYIDTRGWVGSIHTSTGDS